MAELRKYREDQYEQLLSAVYKRRGWTENGIPTKEKLASLGIDLPDLLEIIT
jgi:aldehyde:ferredoxin oxidoreductase